MLTGFAGLSSTLCNASPKSNPKNPAFMGFLANLKMRGFLRYQCANRRDRRGPGSGMALDDSAVRGGRTGHAGRHGVGGGRYGAKVVTGTADAVKRDTTLAAAQIKRRHRIPSAPRRALPLPM